VRGADHMLSEKSQRTQNGTMFVDLDSPLNTSSLLSASAELLVFPSGGRNHRQYSLRLKYDGSGQLSLGWTDWVGPGVWLRNEIVYLPEGSHPSQY